MAIERYRQIMIEGNNHAVEPLSISEDGSVRSLAEFTRRISAIGGTQGMGFIYRPNARERPILDVIIHWKQSVFPTIETDMGVSTVQRILTRAYHRELASALFAEGMNVFMEDVHPNSWGGRIEDGRTDLCETPEDFNRLVAEWTRPEEGDTMFTIPLPLAHAEDKELPK